MFKGTIKKFGLDESSPYILICMKNGACPHFMSQFLDNLNKKGRLT